MGMWEEAAKQSQAAERAANDAASARAADAETQASAIREFVSAMHKLGIAPLELELRSSWYDTEFGRGGLRPNGNRIQGWPVAAYQYPHGRSDTGHLAVTIDGRLINTGCQPDKPPKKMFSAQLPAEIRFEAVPYNSKSASRPTKFNSLPLHSGTFEFGHVYGDVDYNFNRIYDTVPVYRTDEFGRRHSLHDDAYPEYTPLPDVLRHALAHYMQR